MELLQQLRLIQKIIFMQSVHGKHVFPSNYRDFQCLRQQVNEFFHQFVNMKWGVKGIGDLLLLKR